MWPPAALEFLEELEANNDRDWFRANRARYDHDLLAPTRRLAEQLAHLGQPHFFAPTAIRASGLAETVGPSTRARRR